jgi:hypothetical protein
VSTHSAINKGRGHKNTKIRLLVYTFTALGDKDDVAYIRKLLCFERVSLKWGLTPGSPIFGYALVLHALSSIRLCVQEVSGVVIRDQLQNFHSEINYSLRFVILTSSTYSQ